MKLNKTLFLIIPTLLYICLFLIAQTLGTKTAVLSKSAIGNTSRPEATIEKALTYINASQKALSQLEASEAGTNVNFSALYKQYKEARSELEKTKSALQTQNFKVNSNFAQYSQDIMLLKIVSIAGIISVIGIFIVFSLKQ